MAQQLIETHSKELKEFDDLIKAKSDLPQNIGKKYLKVFFRFLLSIYF